MSIAQEVYVFSAGNRFGRLNVLTGSYTFIGNPPLTSDNSYLLNGGLAFGNDGQLYGLGSEPAGGSNRTLNLYRVGTTDASASFVVPTGLTGPHTASFSLGGTSDGALYMQTTLFGNNSVYSLDRVTGTPTLLTSSGTNTGYAVVGDGSGNLYVQSVSNQLVKVDRATGATTYLGQFGFSSPAYAMAWTNGGMYALDILGRIFSVDPSDPSQTHVVATYDVGNIGAIYAAASNFGAVPEPGTVVGLGLGALAVIRRQRHKSRI